MYSPVHRIGKTRFALRLGEKLSEQIPVLYLNLEGYAGGSYYFPEETEQDLGDLIYCMKQERDRSRVKDQFYDRTSGRDGLYHAHGK